MSGFFGVFSPGGNLDQVAFDQMKSAVHQDGCNELETYVDDHIAMGHLMLRVTPESAYDKQPLQSECSRCLLVGHFRLDYRDELGDKLGLTHKELEETPDSLLVMRAYQKWGNNCVHQLEGDWSFIIYNKEVNNLILFRDPCGYSFLAYFERNDCIYFTTISSLFFSIKKLSFKIDFEQLIKLSIDRGRIDDGRTLLHGVFSLKSSTIVNIFSNFKLTEQKYNFIDLAEIRYRFKCDYFYELKSRLSVAIKQKIRSGEVGIFQSSGFDSSSILYFVANELAHQNLNFQTFTAYPKYLNYFSKDKQKKISEVNGVRSLVSDFSNAKSVFSDFENVKLNDLLSVPKLSNIINPIVNCNSIWIDGILNLANESEIKIMLAGKMGNYTYSWSAPYLGGSYFFRLKWKSFFRYCKNSAVIAGQSVFKVILREIYRPVSFHSKTIWRRLKNHLFSVKNKSSVFNQKIVKKYSSESLKLTKFHPEFTGYSSPQKLRKLIFESNLDQLGQRSYLDSQFYNLLLVDPFTDIRFIKYTFNIPEELFNHMGEAKYISKALLNTAFKKNQFSSDSVYPQSYDIGVRLKKDFDIISYLKEFKVYNENNSLFNFQTIFQNINSIKDTENDVSDMMLAQQVLKSVSIIAFFDFINEHNQ
jgi:asparagine synthase (glutamine-hydrolysing)